LRTHSRVPSPDVPSPNVPSPFLYSDLAIGTSPDGYDTWAYGDLFLQGASVGAPPDPYSAEGQNWGLPPIDPRRLAEDSYRFWITLVRQSLRHAGALRMDHVMGLFRQFWIPEGRSGKDGAYVRFPSEELLGILALESTRAGALVVGEDLGTVPREVPPALERWGILSSKVLYFERDRRGVFRPAAKYPARALATANTHDMATLEGFRRAADVDVRERVGLASAREAAKARVERRSDVRRLLERLAAEGVLPTPLSQAAAELPGPVFRGAVHAFLCRTPSALVGLMLDDLAGEVEAVNVPGVSPDTFPSWRRKMRMSLEEMRESDDVKTAMRTEGRETRDAGSRDVGTRDPGVDARITQRESLARRRADALPTEPAAR
jgi:4-alpha-glucanotransferase